MRKYNWHKEVDGQPIRINWKEAAAVILLALMLLI